MLVAYPNWLRHFSPLAIFVVVIFSLIGPARAQGQAPPLDRPRVSLVGDTWTYKWAGETIVFTYLGRDGDLNCYSARASNRESTECRTSEDNPVRRIGGWRQGTFTPYLPLLSFPLFVGKQWEVSYSRGSDQIVSAAGRGHHEMSANRILRARVVSYEKVTVPAGTFDAFKIEGSGGRWGEAVGLPSFVYYYSPEVGLVKYDEVVNILGGIHYELVNYTRAK
jgi:hypothetical protein